MNILVVGATSGIATPLIRRLLCQGHIVVGTARNDAQAAKARSANPGLATFRLDMADGDGIQTALADGLRGLQVPLDAVVICAGASGYGELECAPLDAFRRTLEVNVVACLAIYQAMIPMLRKTGGRFIFVSSYAGKVATPFIGAYQASKSALESLGDAMRQEARHSGVKVVMVLPGGIDTPMCANMLRTLDGDIEGLGPLQDELYGHYYRGQREMLRHAELLDPDEVAATIQTAIEAEHPDTRYVIGDGAKFMIEQRLKLDDRAMDDFAEQLFQEAIDSKA